MPTTRTDRIVMNPNGDFGQTIKSREGPTLANRVLPSIHAPILDLIDNDRHVRAVPIPGLD